jgi:hypothetical protein
MWDIINMWARELQEYSPKVAFEWAAFLLRVRGVPGSNIGQQTMYLKVSVVSPAPRGKRWDNTPKLSTTAFFTSTPKHYSLTILPWDFT